MKSQIVPMYTTIDSVKLRLVNKVQFQQKANVIVEGEMPDALLLQIIQDAETEVEQDLRGRYSIPFRSKSTGKFADLPDHSKRAIRMVVDELAVLKVLDTDFGRGSHITAEGYMENKEKNYDKQITKLLGRDKEGNSSPHDRFRFSPPLEGMLLAVGNMEADDGYKGRIINTDASPDASTYASETINDPSLSYAGRRFNRGGY